MLKQIEGKKPVRPISDFSLGQMHGWRQVSDDKATIMMANPLHAATDMINAMIEEISPTI